MELSPSQIICRLALVATVVFVVFTVAWYAPWPV